MFPGQSRRLRATFIALGEMIVDTVLSHRRCSGRGRILTTFFFNHKHLPVDNPKHRDLNTDWLAPSDDLIAAELARLLASPD